MSILKISYCILYLVTLSVLIDVHPVTAITTCNANSVASLKSCVQNIVNYDEISITTNITCNGADCCGTNYAPFLDIINGKNNKTIRGNGYTITRRDNQRLCNALRLVNINNITISNLNFDEDSADGPCAVGDSCKETIYLYNADSITMDNVKVKNGKAYVVYVWGSDYFTFRNSQITNAGIIGLYVGHIDYAPSRYLSVTGSLFADTRTNAIAIEGVTGMNANDNIISGNTFLRNHYYGLWNDCGGICGGGQIYIAMADHLLVQNNTIGDGFCRNCIQHAVFGFELGYPGRAYALRNVTILSNKVYDQHKYAACLVTGSTIDSTVQLNYNTFVNNGAGITAPGSSQTGNIVKNTRVFRSWESSTVWPSGWNTWQLCSTGASIVRWCPGPSEAMDGNCVLRMMTSSLSCNDGWQGIWTQGMYNSVGPNQKVYLSNWSRNGSIWTGKTCLVFLNSSYQELGQVCKDHTLDSWMYDPDPFIEAVTPTGNAYVAVKFGATAANGYVDLDNARLAW